MVVYGHIPGGDVRNIASANGERIVVNSGSVGLSYDGDCRAWYLLLDGNKVTIRRVEYDIEKEQKALYSSSLPHADWIAEILCTGRPQMPRVDLSAAF